MHLKLTSAPKEPVGGSAPKLTGVSVRVYLGAFQHQPLALSCPAQGAPVPAFRFVNLTMTTELKKQRKGRSVFILITFFVIKRTKNSAFWFGSKDEDCIFFHYFLASSRLNYLALLYI